MQLRCYTIYDTRTACGELRLLSFYCTVNSFPCVNSVTHALWLCPMWRLHYVWQAMPTLFLLYHELFSDRELFTDHEFHDTCTSAPPHVTHALRVASYARSFSIVLWTLFWTIYRPWIPWHMHFRSAQCNACTTCGELRLLSFYCTVNSFPSVNSLPTVNSMTHALWLRPIWRMHYVWQALHAIFILYHELFSNR